MRDAGLAKKGRCYECNEYFLRSAYRALHDPAAPLEAETADRRVPITEDVPIMRIEHISNESLLLGVWQALYGGGALDCKEMNRRFSQLEQKTVNPKH